MPTRSTSTEKPTRTKTRSSVLPPTEKTKKSPELTSSPTEGESTSFAGSINQDDREQMIRETAYYLAERDGFPEGQDEEYWRRAEEQIEKMLQA